MEIPDNWQEELMLHDWKLMKIERCKRAFMTGAPTYDFPNSIQLRLSTIKIDFERANAVVAAMSDWQPMMKVKKGVATIKLNWNRYKSLTEGELEDFKWRIYSLDI
jgi:hypothetical protein